MRRRSANRMLSCPDDSVASTRGSLSTTNRCVTQSKLPASHFGRPIRRLSLNQFSGNISVRDDTLFVDEVVIRASETSLSVDGAIAKLPDKSRAEPAAAFERVSVPELSRLAPVLEGVDLQPGVALALAGPLNQLNIELDLQSTAGEVSGDLLADLTSPGQAVSGVVSIRHLNVAPLLNGFDRGSDITADLRLDLRGPSISDLRSIGGTMSLEAPRIVVGEWAAQQVSADARIDGRELDLKGRVSAYGASATVRGAIVLPEDQGGAVRFDLQGQARHLDLQRLPRALAWPSASTDINTGCTRSAAPPRRQGPVPFEPALPEF